VCIQAYNTIYDLRLVSFDNILRYIFWFGYFILNDYEVVIITKKKVKIKIYFGIILVINYIAYLCNLF